MVTQRPRCATSASMFSLEHQEAGPLRSGLCHVLHHTGLLGAQVQLCHSSKELLQLVKAEFVFGSLRLWDTMQRPAGAEQVTWT